MQGLEKRLVDGLTRLDDELCEVRSGESRHTVAEAAAHEQVGVLFAHRQDQRTSGRTMPMRNFTISGGLIFVECLAGVEPEL